MGNNPSAQPPGELRGSYPGLTLDLLPWAYTLDEKGIYRCALYYTEARPPVNLPSSPLTRDFQLFITTERFPQPKQQPSINYFSQLYLSPFSLS